MKKKMPTSATNELGKHPSKKVITELLDYQQRKDKLVVGLWKTSQNYEVTTATNGNNCLLEINEEMKNLFHREGYGEILDH